MAQNSKGSALSSFTHHGSHTAREREDSGSEPDLLPIVELEPRICLGLAFKKSTRAPMVIRPLLLALPFFVNELARPFPPSSLIIRSIFMIVYTITKTWQFIYYLLVFNIQYK